MNIMPWSVLLWRFEDGSTAVDERAIRYLCQWLTEQEAVQLCCSLSRRRLSGLELYLREALP